MKAFTVIMILLLLPFIAAGCSEIDADGKAVPPVDNTSKTITVEITGAEFETQSAIVRTIDVLNPGSVIVILDSNQTTGFSWTPDPVNTNPDVLYRYEYNYVAPAETGVVGAAGKEVWTFKPKTTGTATLTFAYSRPWESIPAARTLTLTINVK